MPSRFNAPVWAFVVVLAAYLPQVVAVNWWPPLGAFLFVAFVLTVVGFKQERLLSSVIMLLVLFIVGPFQAFVVPFMHAASFGHSQQDAAVTTQLAASENATPAPPASDAGGVARSQQLAIQRHPALAVKDSPLNAAFLARYAQWKQRGDPRLALANWPEVLADDCAEHP